MPQAEDRRHRVHMVSEPVVEGRREIKSYAHRATRWTPEQEGRRTAGGPSTPRTLLARGSAPHHFEREEWQNNATDSVQLTVPTTWAPNRPLPRGANEEPAALRRARFGTTPNRVHNKNNPPTRTHEHTRARTHTRARSHTRTHARVATHTTTI